MVNAEREEDFNSQNVKTVESLQKKGTRGTRWELFFRDGSSFFLYEDILVKYGLTNGVSVSEEEWETILSANEQHEVKLQALKYLSNREHSKLELRQKLLSKGFDASSISLAISELEDNDWQSDFRFSLQWAYSRVKRKAEGRNTVLAGLMHRGVNRSIALKAIDEVYNQFEINSIIERSLLKFSSSDIFDQRQYLYKKGFNTQEISFYFENKNE